MMINEGRLRAIKAQHGFMQRRIDNGETNKFSPNTQKHRGELIAEVERLRGCIEEICGAAHGLVTPEPIIKMAMDALEEPERGKPDFVCRRK